MRSLAAHAVATWQAKYATWLLHETLDLYQNQVLRDRQ